MSKYKVGDIVKLSTGDKAIITRMFRDNVNEVFRYSATIEDDDYDEYNLDEKEIVGLWKECKSSEQVSKSEGKYKLIDVLNKIANGELKEGTQLKWKDKKYWKDKEYILIDGIFTRYIEFPNARSFLLEDMGALYRTDTEWLNDEVELIEPQEPIECEHEWENYTKHRIGEGIIRRFRRCDKCGLQEEIEEPTDNTKIEELECGDKYGGITARIINKLNEVIREINKEE